MTVCSCLKVTTRMKENTELLGFLWRQCKRRTRTYLFLVDLGTGLLYYAIRFQLQTTRLGFSNTFVNFELKICLFFGERKRYRSGFFQSDKLSYFVSTQTDVTVVHNKTATSAVWAARFIEAVGNFPALSVLKLTKYIHLLNVLEIIFLIHLSYFMAIS